SAAAQHAPAQHVQPALREHSYLAPVLVLEVVRGLLPRDRLRLVDRAAAALRHQVREAEVVAEPRLVLDVVRAAHGVDRAVSAGDRAERGLAPAHPELEAPVDPFAVRPARALEAQPPAGVRDIRV